MLPGGLLVVMEGIRLGIRGDVRYDSCFDFLFLLYQIITGLSSFLSFSVFVCLTDGWACCSNESDGVPG